MLRKLEINYTRKFDMTVGVHLGSGSLANLTYLDLSGCPIFVGLEPMVEGCPNLRTFLLAGDSWVRQIALNSITQFRALEYFHLGHFEHSDCDCKSVVPSDPIFSEYSAKGYTVAKIFEDP